MKALIVASILTLVAMAPALVLHHCATPKAPAHTQSHSGDICAPGSSC